MGGGEAADIILPRLTAGATGFGDGAVVALSPGDHVEARIAGIGVCRFTYAKD